MKESPVEKHKLVYAITQHPELGYRIEAFSVALNKDESFSLTEVKVYPVTLNPSAYHVTDTDQELVSIINEYSEETILRKNAVKTKKFADFLRQECDKDKLEKIILPYINRRMNIIFGILTEAGIPLYYKGKKNDYIREEKITIKKENVEVIFNVIRYSDGLKYYLSIREKERDIYLFREKPVFLTSEPVRLMIDRNIYSFDTDFDRRKLQPFLSNEFIFVPKNIEHKYFQVFLLKTLQKYDIEASGFTIHKSISTFLPVLRLKSDWQYEAALILEFRYPEKTYTPADPDSCSVKMTEKGADYFFEKRMRDRKRENEIIELLKSNGLILTSGTAFITKAMQEARELAVDPVYLLINWLNENEDVLLNCGIRIDQNFKSVNYFTGEITIDFKIKDKIDWFDIYAVAKFGDFSIPLIKLRKHIVYGRREFQLPDGTIAVLPESWFTEYKDTLIYSRDNDGLLRIDKRLYKLIQRSQSGYKTGNDQKIDNLALLPGFKIEKADKNFKGEMRPYQLTGFNWMYYISRNGFGCCLADDMGLGKTIQALALLLKTKSDQGQEGTENKLRTGIQLDLFSTTEVVKPANLSLIVMPTSLIHNWVKEINKFAPNLKTHVHSGIKRARNNSGFYNYDLILTSYGLIRNDLFLFRDIEFNYIILDESQVIKNPDSKIFESIIQLKSKHRIIMTGTPIENSLSDLWSQFHFINPGLLGELNSFKKRFILPIEKGDEKNPRLKLKELISPFILRRTKPEVEKDLPPLIEMIRYCEMTEDQSRFYEDKKSEIRNFVFREIEKEGFQKKMFVVLKGLMQLRQISSHPVLSDESYHSDSGKFRDVVHHINNLIAGDHKVLIFSSFVMHLNLFSNYLYKNGIDYAMLTGSTPEANRKHVTERFQDDISCKVFLISIKAGGFGLNLTAADYVFILDPWWNPAVEVQAINRAHRIGQGKNVVAYKFITKNSVEEKILLLQERKKNLASEFIGHNNPLRTLEMSEVKALFE